MAINFFSPQYNTLSATSVATLEVSSNSSRVQELCTQLQEYFQEHKYKRGRYNSATTKRLNQAILATQELAQHKQISVDKWSFVICVAQVSKIHETAVILKELEKLMDKSFSEAPTPISGNLV